MPRARQAKKVVMNVADMTGGASRGLKPRLVAYPKRRTLVSKPSTQIGVAGSARAGLTANCDLLTHVVRDFASTMTNSIA